MNKNIRYALYVILIIVSAFMAACGGGSNAGDTDSPVISTKGEAPQLAEPADHGGGYGWENDKCYLCHPVVELKGVHSFSPSLGQSFAKVGEDDIGACLYCHGTNGLTGITADTYQCTTCHTDSSIVRTAGMFGGHNMHDLDGDGQIANSDCVICHSYSDMNGVVDANKDFTASSSPYENVSGFCLNCHDGNGAFGIMPPSLTFEQESTNLYSTYAGSGSTEAEKRQTADMHGFQNAGEQSFAVFRGSNTYNAEVSCLSCHQAHTSDNPFLIAETGAGAALSDDDARAASVSVTENEYSELCAVCHMTVGGPVTGNGLTSVVHTSTHSSDCSDCHYHGAGFGTDRSGLF